MINCDCDNEQKTMERRIAAVTYRLVIADGPKVDKERIQAIISNKNLQKEMFSEILAKYWEWASQLNDVLGDLALEIHGPSDAVHYAHVFVPKERWLEAEARLKQAGYSLH